MGHPFLTNKEWWPMYEASACDKMPQKTEEYFYNQEHTAYVCNYTESEKTEWFF